LEGLEDMDLVSEDLDDPTSNCRREAGMTAGSNSSSGRIYDDIHSSSSSPSLRGNCPRDIRLVLAWDRILSYHAISLVQSMHMDIACCPVPLYSKLTKRCRKGTSPTEHPAA